MRKEKKGGLVWYIYGSKTDEGTGAGVYRWGLRKGIALVLGSTPPYFRQNCMLLGHA